MIDKSKIISEYASNPTNTGDSIVQIAIFTARIQELTSHLKIHPKDHASRRGMLQIVSRRRSLLDYVKKGSLDTYQSIIQRLGIRK